MPRPFQGDRLVIASHNAGKVREIEALLRPFGVTPVSAADLGLAEPEETAMSFTGNAEIKARAAARAAGLPALADDSGLEVAALGNQPGIYSARWAGAGKDFAAAMARIAREIKAKGSRETRARFVCALSLCWPDAHCETFIGRVEGELAFPPRGNHGFGYDPIFRPAGGVLTFGEMEPEAKHAISHRADAFRQLIAACFARS